MGDLKNSNRIILKLTDKSGQLVRGTVVEQDDGTLIITSNEWHELSCYTLGQEAPCYFCNTNVEVEDINRVETPYNGHIIVCAECLKKHCHTDDELLRTYRLNNVLISGVL